MIILTAATKSHMELALLQRESVERFDVGEHVILPIHDSYQKHPSWFRIRGLIDHLPRQDFILWMDTDSIMLRSPDWDVMMPGSANLFVAKDHNGLNNGVAIWRNTPENIDLLWDIYDSHWAFRKHPWHEQGALHTMQERIKIHWIDKPLLDSYVLHLPNRSYAERIMLMRAQILGDKARFSIMPEKGGFAVIAQSHGTAPGCIRFCQTRDEAEDKVEEFKKMGA